LRFPIFSQLKKHLLLDALLGWRSRLKVNHTLRLVLLLE